MCCWIVQIGNEDLSNRRMKKFKKNKTRPVLRLDAFHNGFFFPKVKDGRFLPVRSLNIIYASIISAVNLVSGKIVKLLMDFPGKSLMAYKYQINRRFPCYIHTHTYTYCTCCKRMRSNNSTDCVRSLFGNGVDMRCNY